MGSETVLTQKPLKSKRRRITKHDIRAIAALVVKYKMNETEACLDYGINPKQWSLFKHRHKTSETFEELINGIRAQNLRNCVDSISKAGDDREFETVNKQGESATITKPGDWRAKAWIAERVLAAERFGQQQQAPSTVQVSLYQQIGIDVQRLIAEAYSKPKAVDVPAETKLLPHKSE